MMKKMSMSYLSQENIHTTLLLGQKYANQIRIQIESHLPRLNVHETTTYGLYEATQVSTVLMR